MASQKCLYPSCTNVSYVDPSGVVYNFCSTAHQNAYQLPVQAPPVYGVPAAQHALQQVAIAPPSPGGPKFCRYPGCKNAGYQENGYYYDYCCTAHMNAVVNGVVAPQVAPPPAAPVVGGPVNYVAPKPAAVPAKKCQLPGCTKDAWVDPSNGVVSDYCGNTHRKEAFKAKEAAKAPLGTCKKCKKGAAPDKTICVPCNWEDTSITTIWNSGDDAAALLPHSHPEYIEKEAQFLNKWKGASKPKVINILALYPPKSYRDLFDARREKVENEGKFDGRKGKNGRAMTRGNVNIRFHGTGITCQFGLDNNVKPCSSASCAVCNIFRVGWRMPQKPRFERFGYGIYFTSTSSKSNSYNASSERTSNGVKTKCMFMAKVVVGRGLKLYKEDHDREQPDPGYHSVLAEETQGINDDECIVYEPGSCIPAYLVIYSV